MGIWDNEKADELAKEGALQGIHNIHSLTDNNNIIRVTPEWIDIHSHRNLIIDRKLRSFIKYTNKLEHQIGWSTNRAIRDLRCGATSFEVNATSIRMDNIRGNKCRSLKSSNKITFAIKLMNDLLPTKDLIQHRYRKISIDTYCNFCKSNEESIRHLVSCHQLEDKWKLICKNALIKLEKRMKSSLDIDINSHSLLTYLTANLQLESHILHHLLKGIAPTYIRNQLPNECKDMSNNKIDNIIAFLIQQIQEGFRTHIWLPRNNMFHEDLKARNTSLKQLILDAKEKVKEDKKKTLAVSPDDASYNIWDGLPDNSHLDLHNKEDHLGRKIMNVKDREEWISQIWTKQVVDLIKEGNRDDWEYKKGNNKIFKNKKREQGKMGCKRDSGNNKEREYNT